MTEQNWIMYAGQAMAIILFVAMMAMGIWSDITEENDKEI